MQREKVTRLSARIASVSLIAFSQREMYTGPLTHWVELRKK
jgi:hypothetical protein